MGVRFECPQGHKLHVKAHLAGQRAICPECGMRFIVPTFSGGRVAEAASETPSTVGGFVSVAVESSATFNAGLNAATGADGDEGDDSIGWHVRPETGGQYGPVDAATFAQWIAEGRVTADAWVWRTGWKDWRPGSEALKQFVPAGPPPLPSTPPAPSPALASIPRAPARTTPPTPSTSSMPFDADLGDLLAAPRNGRPTLGTSATTDAPIASARAEQMRRRKQLNQWLTIGLAVLALVLLIVAVVVLRRGPQATESAPASPTAGEPFADAPAKP